MAFLHNDFYNHLKRIVVKGARKMERRMLWEKQIADEKNHKFTLRYFLLVHPVPMGENVYGVAIDKISGGQILEREEVSGLSEQREEMIGFLQKLCQGDALPMELAELGDDYISAKEFI